MNGKWEERYLAIPAGDGGKVVHARMGAAGWEFYVVPIYAKGSKVLSLALRLAGLKW
jgi:hypothetical protein